MIRRSVAMQTTKEGGSYQKNSTPSTAMVAGAVRVSKRREVGVCAGAQGSPGLAEGLPSSPNLRI
jgi:hypothetical protein